MAAWGSGPSSSQELEHLASVADLGLQEYEVLGLVVLPYVTRVGAVGLCQERSIAVGRGPVARTVKETEVSLQHRQESDDHRHGLHPAGGRLYDAVAVGVHDEDCVLDQMNA